MDLIDSLKSGNIRPDQLLEILNDQARYQEPITLMAQEISKNIWDNKVYVRALIEVSNICHNDCYYCGIRRGNDNVTRYQLSTEEILDTVRTSYDLGYSTVVLQGGENDLYSTDQIVDLIKEIKAIDRDKAVTLSLGERSKSEYRAYKEAGADRYLLRHETVDPDHYNHIHPLEMSIDTRKQCLLVLKDLGYEVGSGFMVGSPGQTLDHLVQDLMFLKDLDPQMIGIGPYLSHKDTPMSRESDGSFDLTIYLISILRVMFPYANIPATTSLQTLDPQGRDRAVKAGANVFMPNMTPKTTRDNYTLYDNKATTDLEAGENLNQLKKYIADIGYQIVMDRGDGKNRSKNVQQIF